MKINFKKIIVVSVSIFFILLVTIILVCMNQLNNIEWKSDKNYYFFIVETGEIADYNVFISPYGEYEKLNAIDINTREKIAQYMKDNNLCLAEGEQCFDRLDYTYEELIFDYFRFNSIS